MENPLGFTGQDPELRKKQHFTFAFQENNKHHVKKVLYQAIRKYGVENFDFDVIYESENREETLLKETFFISEYKTFLGLEDCKGYNADTGGLVPEKTQEQIQKHRELLTGKKKPSGFSELVSKRVSGEGNPMFGKLGEDNPNYGSKRTEEAKNKMSESQKQHYANGGVSPMKGKSHSEEAKAEMAAANTKTYTAIREDGSTFPIDDLKAFCDGLGLTTTHFNKLSRELKFYSGVRLLHSTHKNGTVYTYGIDAFVRKPRGAQKENQKKTTSKKLATYHVLETPDGRKILIQNLRKCAKHYGFSDGCMHGLGKTKGFILLHKNVDPKDYQELPFEDYT